MKKILPLIILFLCALSLGSQPTYAATMAFSVKANLPENQIDKQKTYFDLKMKPGEKQEISLTVHNADTKEVKISIVPNVALTNQNGVIDYSQEKSKKDSSLKVPITSIISKKQEVTLAPNETKDAKFSIQMPAEEYDGIILGGFYIYKETPEDEEGKEKNVQIKNRYSYVIGLQLSETEAPVIPELKLNQIKPALQNYRTAVTANIQNAEATILNDLGVVAKVTKKGNSKVLHEEKKDGLSMAPNSNFDFPISWDNQRLEAGDYTLDLVAKGQDKEWKFEQDFSIKDKDMKKLNTEAVELERGEPNWVMLILSVVGGLFVLIIVLVVILYKRKQKKERLRKERIRRKKAIQKKKNEAKNPKKTKVRK